MAEERLTDDEVAAVLRRAADLDGGAGPAADGLPVAVVEAAAAEAGLSPAAVRQAVAELRAGALDDDALTAPGVVVCARVVPAAPDDALVSVGRYLSHQALVRARDRGREQVWRPRDDVVATLRRKLDLTGSLRLRALDEVVVRTVEVEGGTLVRVIARLDATSASAPSIGAGIGSTLGTAGAGAAAALTGDAVWLVATAASAPAAGVLGWRIGRRVRGERRRTVAEAIDGMLDELERGRGTGRWERTGRHLRRVYRL